MNPLGIGIDFGTTNSIVAAWGSDVERLSADGLPLAFWGPEDRPHPSVVWYAAGADPVVGQEARLRMADLQGEAMGHRFIRSVKRELGYDRDVETLAGQRKKAWEVAADIFLFLKKHAENALSGDRKEVQLTECVVTIPVQFTGAQRRELRKAANRAGMHLRTFLHEPFAALIGHYYKAKGKLNDLRGQRVLVSDWGGGTLDVCLARVSEDGKRVYELSHDALNDCAGDDFDHRIMSHLKTRFLATKSNIKAEDILLDPATSGRFWLNAERAKIDLSSATTSTVVVPAFLRIGDQIINLQESISRAEFEGLIQNSVDAARRTIENCLQRASIRPGLVDQVLLVGGTSRIPAVRAMVEDLFGCPKVAVAHQPDAVIARGAAIAAAEGWNTYNVRDIGVRLSDETSFTVFPANERLDACASRSFTFFCTDHRTGAAHLPFTERHMHGLRDLGVYLSVPTRPEVKSIEHLDRILTKFVVTDDLTLMCTAESSSVGQKAGVEIEDVCFGLEMDGA